MSAWILAPALAAALLFSGGASAVEFKNALTNAPLDVKPKTGEVETDAVKSFKETGENPYNADAAAIEAGKKLYATNCATCHLPDGTGRIGPNIIDDTVVRERTGTDVGMFEIIYGGGSGAMQSFHRRGMVQDDMLKIMAYVRSLKK
jgi:cytochrome c-L